jgi:hypothetical protein
MDATGIPAGPYWKPRAPAWASKDCLKLLNSAPTRMAGAGHLGGERLEVRAQVTGSFDAKQQR